MKAVLFAVELLGRRNCCCTQGPSFTGGLDHRVHLQASHRERARGGAERRCVFCIPPTGAGAAPPRWVRWRKMPVAGAAPSRGGGVWKMPGLALRRCGKVAYGNIDRALSLYMHRSPLSAPLPQLLLSAAALSNSPSTSVNFFAAQFPFRTAMPR